MVVDPRSSILDAGYKILELGIWMSISFKFLIEYRVSSIEYRVSSIQHLFMTSIVIT